MNNEQKHVEHFHSLERYDIGAMLNEFCLGMVHQAWFIGIVIEANNQPQVAVIATSNHSLVKIGSVLSPVLVRKAVPLMRKPFKNVIEGDSPKYFYTDRDPKRLGTPYRRFGVTALEKGVPESAPSSFEKRIQLSNDELVYVPIRKY